MSETEGVILAHEATDLIARSWQTMEYRPTVVAAIRNRQGQALFVESAKYADEWGFIQGGIDEGETLSDAFLREAEEEAGIAPHELRIGAITEVTAIKAPAERVDKRGFAKGKLYFVTQADYSGSGLLVLDSKELSADIWVDDTEAREYLKNKRAEKRALIKRALAASRP